MTLLATLTTCFAAAVLLSGCAVQPVPPAQPVQHPHGHVDVLLSTDRGMHGIAFDSAHTYLALSNSAT